jgi:hypothetical protein
MDDVGALIAKPFFCLYVLSRNLKWFCVVISWIIFRTSFVSAFSVFCYVENFNTGISVFLIYELGIQVFHDKCLL